MSATIFVSAAWHDRGAALRLCARLERHGLTCWLSGRDASLADDRATTQAIRHARLVLVLNPDCVPADKRVSRELEIARSQDKSVVPLAYANSIVAVPPPDAANDAFEPLRLHRALSGGLAAMALVLLATVATFASHHAPSSSQIGLSVAMASVALPPLPSLLEQARAAAQHEDWAEARRLFTRAAGEGKPEALVELALMLRDEPGPADDPNEPARLFRQAADQGDAAGAYNLAVLYLRGIGTKQDIPQAVAWYRRAATLGNAAAASDLGVLYSNGLGVEKDTDEALRLYRSAAEKGFPDAAYNMGVIYARGTDVAQDYAEAIRWFRKAADQGVVDAMVYLGFLSERGLGTAQDDRAAAAWYQKAASSGDATAQRWLDRQKIARQ